MDREQCDSVLLLGANYKQVSEESHWSWVYPKMMQTDASLHRGREQTPFLQSVKRLALHFKDLYCLGFFFFSYCKRKLLERDKSGTEEVKEKIILSCTSIPLLCSFIQPPFFTSSFSLSLLIFFLLCCCDCLSPRGPMPSHHWVAFLIPSQREREGSEWERREGRVGRGEERKTNGRNESEDHRVRLFLFPSLLYWVWCYISVTLLRGRGAVCTPAFLPHWS